MMSHGALTDAIQTKKEWSNAFLRADYTARKGAGFGDLDMGLVQSEMGISILESMIAGHFPVPRACNARHYYLKTVSIGRAMMIGIADSSCLNPMGTVHGGWMSEILDSAMGSAVMSLMPKGFVYVTTAIQVAFRKPLAPTVFVQAEAHVDPNDLCDIRIIPDKRRPTFRTGAKLRGPSGEIYAEADGEFRAIKASLLESSQ